MDASTILGLTVVVIVVVPLFYWWYRAARYLQDSADVTQYVITFVTAGKYRIDGPHNQLFFARSYAEARERVQELAEEARLMLEGD